MRKIKVLSGIIAVLFMLSAIQGIVFAEGISRGDAVAAIWQLEGNPDSQGDSAFVDVADGDEYETAVIWATARGITNGVSEDAFGVAEAVSREQLATLLYRFAEKSNAVAETEYTAEIADIDSVSDYAADAIKWAVSNGITETSDGIVNPGGNVTEAELEKAVSVTKEILVNPEMKEYPVLGGEYVRLLGRGEVFEDGKTFNWPNAGIEFVFSGNTAEIYADISNYDNEVVQGNYFTVAVYNGDELIRTERIKLMAGWNVIYNGQDDDPEEKKIMFVRSSEACRGTIVISKIRTNAEPKATEAREKKIEFIGDSYTAGYANSTHLSDSKWYCAQNTDNWNSFTGMVARHYNADNTVIAYQGKGVYANRALDALDNTMSHQFMYKDIVTDGNAEMLNMSTKALHDFSEYQPQLAVVWLGTNDAAAPVDEATFKDAYEKLINNVREKYPNAVILNIALEDSIYLDEIESVSSSAERGEENGYYMLVLNKFTTSSMEHPDIAEDERIANKLIEKIDSIPDVWAR